MKVSRAKTEYMCLSGAPRGSVQMQDQQLPEVNEFKYPRSTLQTDGGMEAEINRRIQSGWNNWKKMSGVMSDRRIQPALLYGLETLPQKKKTTKRLEVAEIKMCRWECRKTRRDRERNENIRERMKVTNIGVRCRRARLRWFGHVKRREVSYIGRRLLSMEPPGRRGRGRPKQRWEDTISADMRAVGAREEDVDDRDKWKALDLPQ